MMNVQLIRRIVDEVEQGRLPGVACAAVMRWTGHEEVDSLTHVRSSANHIFRFLRDGELHYLRLAHEFERRLPAIEAELDFVQHVASMGLPTVQPAASLNGRLVEEISDQGHRYSAIVFEGLRGDQRELDALDEAGYHAWGRALAMVHRASQTFPAHPARPTWRNQLEDALRELPADETTVAQVLLEGLDWLDTFTVADSDYGLIHGDFELDNLVWNGEQAQALDFDEATYAWYAVDFAAALQDVWLDREMMDAESEERLAWFTAGYASMRPLPKGLGEALPRLLKLVLALKVARMIRAYSTTTEDDALPTWLARMHSRHERWLQAKRALLIWE